MRKSINSVRFLRDELGVDTEEIKDEDIVKAFPPNNNGTSFDSIYVQFNNFESADVCFTKIRIHRDLNLKVFLYIPKRLQNRFAPISKVAYRQRLAGLKTRFVYTEDDIQLLICPKNRYTYYLCPVPNLPEVDLAPAKPPPPGRKPLKRSRPGSDDSSPSQNEPKKDRKISPEKPAETEHHVEAEHPGDEDLN